MLTEVQQKNAKKLRSMVISKINEPTHPTHHLETLFNVNNLSYSDLQDIYHYINTVIMLNTIPIHRHLSKKAKQVIANAGIYKTLDDDK